MRMSKIYCDCYLTNLTFYILFVQKRVQTKIIGNKLHYHECLVKQKRLGILFFFVWKIFVYTLF